MSHGFSPGFQSISPHLSIFLECFDIPEIRENSMSPCGNPHTLMEQCGFWAFGAAPFNSEYEKKQGGFTFCNLVFKYLKHALFFHVDYASGWIMP